MSNGPRYRGKTFHEYMSAKFWHPASKRNIVTVWKRKEQMKAEKRKHDERAEEARRENEKNMVASALGEKKAKLGVSFLYDMPNNIMPKDINAPENQGDLPGMTAKNFEIKFDWQKNAPRDSHFNGMGEVRNSIFNHKPFGIEVRNVKCLKCGAWGHSNFDRTCPLFGKVADRDNPDFDLKREQLELLSSRLQETSTQGYKMKQTVMDGFNIGDTMFDPLEKKRKNKQELPEMEFLKTLDPAEKALLLKTLEKQRKKKKKKEKAEKAKLKEEIKKEIERTTIKKEDIEMPEIKLEPPESESDDEVHEEVEIIIPKRKDEIEAEERLKAKKEFAKKLAEMYSTMKDASSSESETDSEDSDSSIDSDYESKSSSSPSTEKVNIESVPDAVKAKVKPPPKKGMILVRKKKSFSQIESKAKEDLEKQKKLLAYKTALRKKMEQLQKAEMEKQQKLSKSKPKSEPGPSSSVQITDQDLTSGLLDVKSTWKTEPIVKYDSSSDED